MTDETLLADPSDITPISIVDEMKTSYLDYAMSVIVARALPDVRDGLKPVHRRILHAAQEGGYVAGRAYRKSARLVGDVMGLLDALEVESAAVVGHDWGAAVAWHCALLRPDRVRAVAGLSVPYFPRARTYPTSVMPQSADEVFYQLYFCQEGQAESEFNADIRRSLRDFAFF